MDEYTGNNYEEVGGRPRKKKKHTLRNVLILIILWELLCGVLFFMNQNRLNGVKADMAADIAVTAVGSEYRLTPKDVSKYDGLMISGIKTDVEQYDVEGLGNLTVLCSKGRFIKSAAVILTPIKKDMPLLTVQCAYILGNRSVSVEISDVSANFGASYDAVIELAGLGKNYKKLEDSTHERSPYYAAGIEKKLHRENDKDIEDIFMTYFHTYCKEAAKMDTLTADSIKAKVAAVAEYSDFFREAEGIDRDIFGESADGLSAAEFVDNVLFGIAEYR